LDVLTFGYAGHKKQPFDKITFEHFIEEPLEMTSTKVPYKRKLKILTS
jgi:hypothetical protein